MTPLRACLFLFALILCCACVVQVHGKKKSKEDKKKGSSSGDSSTSRLDLIAAKLETRPYLPLTDSTFSKFIVERPRDYYAVIMFTATDKKYQCGVCVMAKKVFTDAAQYYAEQYDFKQITDRSKRLVFFVLEVDDARQTFNDMGLETVPRTYVLPPTEASSPKMKMGDFELEVQKLLEGTAGFLRNIEHMTGGVKISVTTDALPMAFAIGLLAFFLALLAAAAATEPSKALFWYQSRFIWATVSVLCFAVGVSGSIFCVIRSAPMYGQGRSGSPRIFAGQGRDQYLLEGIIVAAMTVGCGLAGMLLYYGTKIPNFYGIGTILQHVAVLLAVSIFITLSLELGEAYIEKTRWYAVKETLHPPEIWVWITSTVKKSSSLPKRLLRLSEYWLFESKGWQAFLSKANDLLVTNWLKKITWKDVYSAFTFSKTK